MSDTGFGGLLGAGGGAIRQLFLWGAAAEVLRSSLQPFFTALANDVNSAHPEVGLSPADAADMVLRGWLTPDEGKAEAAKFGVDAARFSTMVNNTGEPPGLQFLLEAERRGIIPMDGGAGTASVEYGIKSSRVQDTWVDTIKAMKYRLPDIGLIIDAAVENQYDPSKLRELFAQNGIDPEYFNLYYNTRGNPPSVLEAGQLAVRGIIPWTNGGALGVGPPPGKVPPASYSEAAAGAEATSFQQAVAEGATKTKWTDPLSQLLHYRPPAEHVAVMLANGAIDQPTAEKYWAENGLDPEVRTYYLREATHIRLTHYKQLTESMVRSMYVTGIMTVDQAKQALTDLSYSESEADLMIAYMDAEQENSLMRYAVDRIEYEYLAGKTNEEAVKRALADLHIPPELTAYALKRIRYLKAGKGGTALTAAQWADAVYYNICSTEYAIEQLVQMGYSAPDAWMLISIRAHTRMPDAPAGTPPNPAKPNPVA